jgi:hypothetical protein
MSKNYVQIKKLMFSEPAVLHALLQKLADAVVTYIKYQVGGGVISRVRAAVLPCRAAWSRCRPLLAHN